jgi:microcystin-dependent protein
LATTAYTTTAIAAIPAVTAAVVNALAYPVGAIYTSIVSTNPATTLGVGTWTAFGAGRVLVGLNASDSDFDTVEETGGAKTDSHALSIAEMPAHTHAIPTHDDDGPVILNNRNGNSDTTPLNYNANTTSTGSGSAHTHDIVQPYIVVYFWKRTA